MYAIIAKLSSIVAILSSVLIIILLSYSYLNPVYITYEITLTNGSLIKCPSSDFSTNHGILNCGDITYSPTSYESFKKVIIYG